MQYRLARQTDIPQLATLRWQFRMGDRSNPEIEFVTAFSCFMARGLKRGHWVVWVATDEGQIISHIYIQKIEKVPKPNRIHDAYGYVTNVYTRPEFRGQGVGAALMESVKNWAKEADLEFLLVWPSVVSESYYQRAGFTLDEMTLEYEVRPHVD